MVATDERVGVADVIIELLGEKRSEENILEAFAMEGLELHIVKVQRPVCPVDGEWLMYDERCSILQTFMVSSTDDLFLDMVAHSTYRRYYWGFKRDYNFSVLVDVPCHQERRW